MRRAIEAVLDALLMFWFLAIGPFCWFLRDGLGPGAVDSHGMHAVARFLLTFYWGPVLAGARGPASPRAATRTRPPGSRGRCLTSTRRMAG